MNETDEQFFERHVHSMSRRTLLGGAMGAGLLATLGVGAFDAARAYGADGPQTAAGVVTLARSYVGDTLGQVRATTAGRWAEYPDADWCAWFASWCIRGLGTGCLTWADDMRGVGPEVSSPAVGDIVVYGGYHTGIVSKIVGGTPYLIDGNGTSTGPSITTRVVAERPVWGDPHTYTRPDYAAVEPGGTSMAAFLKATDLTNTWYVVEEFQVTTITSQSVASKFGDVYGTSIKVPSAVAQQMAAHALANRTSLISDIASAVNPT